MVKLVGAVVLFGVAVYELAGATARRRSHERRPTADGSAGAGVHWAMVGVGAGLVLPNVALYFPAAHEVAASGEGPAGRAAALCSCS